MNLLRVGYRVCDAPQRRTGRTVSTAALLDPISFRSLRFLETLLR